MSDSAFVDGFTSIELRLPHRPQPIQVPPLSLKKSAELLRLFDQTRSSDSATADLMDKFPEAIGAPEGAFDGLSVAEFLAVVGGFFSVRRDPEALLIPGASAPSSIGPG